jgi:S-adenosylmethionine decarboxylase
MRNSTKGSKRWAVRIKKQNKKYLGNHLIAEFWRGKIIEDEKKLKEILFEAVRKSSNTPLKFTFHKFNPRGITGVVLLAESHIALHAWPEFNYLAIDIFTCGDKARICKALEYLKAVFKPRKVEVREIKRGIL